MRIFIILAIAPLLIFAQAFEKSGQGILVAPSFELSAAIRDFAKIRGKNLVLPENFQSEKVFVYGPKIIQEENFEEYVSSALYHAGYTIMEEAATNTLQVIHSRDIRYMSVPTFKTPQEAPDTYDYIRYIFKLNHISSNNLARNLRPFVSRYGRIIDDKSGNILVLNDTGKTIRRVKELLKIIDTPEFAKGAAKIERMNQAASIEVKEDKGILTVIKDQHFLFIAVFSLIFALIGFIVRGYLLRRIEGGW